MSPVLSNRHAVKSLLAGAALVASAMSIGLSSARTPSAITAAPRIFHPSLPRGSGFRRRINRYLPSRGQDLCAAIRKARTTAALDALLAELRAVGSPKEIARGERRAAERAKALRVFLVHASAGAAGPSLVLALSGEIPAVTGDALPAEIQWMPPGAQKIVARRGDKDEPIELSTVVDAAAAAAVQTAYLQMKAKADSGEGDRPFFDFNHDDREASAWPTAFYWAGDDPKTGGIRAKLEWSRAGTEAVKGRDFRRFSPAFAFDDATGRVVGAPVNMGGLVNRAAFQRIAPIWSKGTDAEDRNQNKQTNTPQTMKSLLAVLAKLGVITSADLDEASVVAQAQANIGALQTERDTHKAKVGTLEAELSTTKAKATDLETKHTAAVKAHATRVVESAITAGRIPPQDEAVKARWIALIQADPENEKLLPAPNAALAEGSIIEAKAGEGTVVTGAKPGEPAHVAKARAWAKATGKTGDLDDLVTDFFTANPKEYDTYRAGLGLGKTAQH